MSLECLINFFDDLASKSREVEYLGKHGFMFDDRGDCQPITHEKTMNKWSL